MTTSIVSGQGVRLRAKPSGAIIGALEKGVRVNAFETAAGWTRVEVTHNGQIRQGWVSAKFLQASVVAAAPAAAPAVPAAAPGGAWGIGDRDAFFARVRTISGLAQLSATQRAGCEAILAACVGFPLSWTAYVLATAAHETGASFDPAKEENLNYAVEGLKVTFSRARISLADCQALGRLPGRPANKQAIANRVYGGAWGKTNLGNTQPNDGWSFRGRGWVQITGRANYARAGAALGLGDALVTHPDRVGELAVCSGITGRGMREGWFTGHKLADHLPSNRPADDDDFTDARWIINKQDKAAHIADLALGFQAALAAGGWR